VVLQLLRSVLLPEGRDLVEVHLQVVRHLLRQLILRSLLDQARVLLRADTLPNRLHLNEAHTLLPILQEVEGLQLVRLHRGLVLVQVRERVLRPVVVRIVVGVDRLGLQTRDGVELLDRRSTEPGQRPEHRPLDLRHLGVLHCVHQGVLGLRRVVLELLRSVLLAEGRDLVEVHLQVVRHLPRQFVLRSLLYTLREDSKNRDVEN